ncbi:MAG: 2-polyprenyl-6-hydroxyphenyl methylase/3-demethylubiquinone-9 3-methyltransferase [Gammaproteobacteria bacterium]|jgi:2-polyprenyl-6-hydroxyphenyl methylase/3-demethylubiquinone-9 3-methyltransferase
MTDTNTQNVNVDPDEIKKFADLASRWWDPEGEFKPLHDMNPLRLGFIDDHAKVSGKTVLDVGCGGGILSEAMAQAGAKVTGLDLGEEQLNVAKLHLLESGTEVDYVCKPVEQLATEQPAHYDAVTCLEMIEHVPDPSQVVKACAELVKPGGKVFFSTINRNPKAYAIAVLGAEYILKVLPQGTHDYQRFIKPSELNNWIEAAGMKLVSISGIHYNPLFKNFTLGGNVDVNYIVCAEKA